MSVRPPNGLLPSHRSTATVRRGSLLIVDDNEPSRFNLLCRLANEGFVVAAAANGDDAVSLAANCRFDLVLLQIDMELTSGLDVLARLRERHSQTELPVIVLTARRQGAVIVRGFRLGANDFVTQPIDLPVALERIRTQLSQKWAIEDLRRSEERYALAARGTNDGFWDWNLVANEVYWSRRWKAMLGYADDEIGVSPDEWLTRVHSEDVERVKAALAAHLRRESAHLEAEHRVLHRNGTFRWMLCRAAAVRDRDGVVTRLAGSLTDITDVKAADPLTGLPNRLRFTDLLDGAVKRIQRDPRQKFALVLLGLDRFKNVTNGLGPPTADRLLVAIARRLQSALREGDGGGRQPVATLARVDGDEFAVLLEDIADARDAARAAKRLQAALREPFAIDGHRLFTSAAVGITLSAEGYVRSADALQDAAIALHRAKNGRASRRELYDPAMRDRAVSRLRVETDLRNALERHEFDVFYQPIVAIASGRITGFEALARWHHPVRGLIGPSEFIPVAEDTGLIRRLGRLILVESCRRMIDWQNRFGAAAPGMMCVNVSGLELAHLDLAVDVEAVLRDTGLDSSRLKLEITESAFICDARAAEATLRRMQAIGVEWSLDDFGTGYSSLSHLHRFRADTLKVDRSFVSRIGVEDQGTDVVRAIVTLAHNLGMSVVAEGVETAAQLSQLRAIGCEYAQGFHFSPPVDAQAAGALIVDQPWAEALRYTDARVDDQSAVSRVSRGSRRQRRASEKAPGSTHTIPAA